MNNDGAMQGFDNNANAPVILEKFILQVLDKNGINQKNQVFGIVEQVISETKLKVYVSSEMQSQIINCPPRVPFEMGDQVLIQNINGNAHDRFVLSIVSGVSTDVEVIDYETLPVFPVEIIRDSVTDKATMFIYGYNNPKTTWTQQLVRDRETQKVISVIEKYPDGAVFQKNLVRNNKGQLIKYE